MQLVSLGPEVLRAAAIQQDSNCHANETNAEQHRHTVSEQSIRDIPYHAIIGDRGRVDSPNSSDGVCWSSYLDGAKSEKIGPSGHGANQNPKGMAEVARILKQHVGSKS
jgi:hypothetical protein